MTADDLADRADKLIAGGDVDDAAELFLTEAAAVPREELDFLKGFQPAWDRIRAGISTASREVRALDASPVDLDAARRIDVPVLVLVGGETTAPVYVDGLNELEKALPDARREIIPGQHHMAPGFAAETFAKLVESFLLGERAQKG